MTRPDVCKLVFLAYLPSGELLTKPSHNLDYVKSVARQHFIFHPDDTIKVYAISDGAPAFECNVLRRGHVFDDSVRSIAATATSKV